MVLALFTLEQYQGRRHENVRDLKQTGRQRQGRPRLNNEFLPCLSTHTAPHLNFSITYKRRVEFQMEIKIICRRGFGSQTTQIVVISRCYFA